MFHIEKSRPEMLTINQHNILSRGTKASYDWRLLPLPHLRAEGPTESPLQSVVITVKSLEDRPRLGVCTSAEISLEHDMKRRDVQATASYRPMKAT